MEHLEQLHRVCSTVTDRTQLRRLLLRLRSAIKYSLDIRPPCIPVERWEKSANLNWSWIPLDSKLFKEEIVVILEQIKQYLTTADHSSVVDYCKSFNSVFNDYEYLPALPLSNPPMCPHHH